jgi:hypothetical protein
MQLTTTVDAQLRVSARLEDDGTGTVKVFATAEYAPGMTTTAESSQEDIPEDVKESILAGLRAARDAAAERMGKKIQQAVHRSTEVAAAKMEI